MFREVLHPYSPLPETHYELYATTDHGAYSTAAVTTMPRDVRLTFYVPCGIDKSRPRVSDVRFYCCCVLLQTRNHVDKNLHMNQRKAKSHSDVLHLRFVKISALIKVLVENP